jgi:RHH-type proline utilization regulon transcriptional repressor/proline dehydrogenase/delta 1-pyrroline-5-carboxylate dehydrogenase
VFTGGTDTAKRILAARPELHLLAETGGKNATIVSSLSDRDLAIKNILHSAFSHAGQKCSATSLLLLEDEVYHDKQFRELFIDAVSSLRVGSAWDLRTKMGPLVRPPQAALLRGLTELEPKERWALMPKNLEDNPCSYSPGIKWEVQPGSFTHVTELFGPVLAVMRYQNLEEAIDLVHQTGYGLTSGLESLDDREQNYWASRVQAGNLYINRPTTGAIVLRQPFGGMGKSAFGPGIKAGGPNYVVPLMSFTGDSFSSYSRRRVEPGSYARQSVDRAASSDGTASADTNLDIVPAIEPLAEFWSVLQSDHPAAVKLRFELGDEGMERFSQALVDYDEFASAEIRQAHDTLKLVGQDNIRRYLSIPRLRIRLHENDDWLDILARAIAVVAVGGRAAISHPPHEHSVKVEQLEAITHIWAGDLEFIEESDGELIEAIKDGEVDRLRYSASDRVPAAVRKAANDRFVYIADAPVTAFGRVELLWYVREQSLCVDYHRYGNLGFRAEEVRQPVM